MLNLLNDFTRNDNDRKAQTIVRVVKEQYRKTLALQQLMKERKKHLVAIDNGKAIIVDEGLISFAGGLATAVVKAGAKNFAKGMGINPSIIDKAGRAINKALKPAKPLRAIAGPATNKITVTNKKTKPKKVKLNPATNKEFGKSTPSDFGLRTGPDAARDARNMVRGGMPGG